jgi:transcriptional regulator with XRE-family HTH domain
MRGVRVNETLFRQLRRARGLSQRELAALAGVGERTVRNAESGQRVRLDFLRFLAVALGADAVDLVHDNDELRTAMREQSRVSNIFLAIRALVQERDTSEYLKLMTRDVVVNIPGPPEVPFCGEFRGTDDVRRLEDINREMLAFERPPEIRDVRTSGKMVVISGQDWLRAIPTGKSFTAWWHHVYEFDNGHIVRFDNWGDTTTTAQAYQAG